MAADEVVLGKAQLILEAEYSKLTEDLNRVKEELRKGEKSFTDLTETASQQGRKLLRDREKVDSALRQLTGTAAQQELAAIDKRYAAALSAAKRQGDRVVEIERAIAAAKRKVRLADSSDELRGSSLMVEAQKNVAAQTTAFGAAAGKTKLKVSQLQAAGGVLRTQVGQLASGLKLAAVGGWGPYAAAIFGTTALMVKFISKANEAQEKALSFLQAAAGQRQQTKEAAVDLKVVTKELTEQAASLEKQRVALDAQRQQLEELDRVAESFHDRTMQASAEMLGVKSREDAQARADSLRLEVAEAQRRLKIAEEIAAVEKAHRESEFADKMNLLNAENREGAARLELSTEEAARREEVVAVERKYLELLKEETDEEHRKAILFQKTFEMQNLEQKQAIEREKEVASLRKAAMQEWRRELAEFNRAAQERLRVERAVYMEILDLRARAADRALEANSGSEQARLHQIKANKERELEIFADKAVQLELAARENGLDVTELEELHWKERQAIVAKYEEQISSRITKEAEGYKLIEISANAAAVAVSGLNQAGIGNPDHPYFKTHVIGPYKGVGTDPFAKQRISAAELEAMRVDAMRMFPTAFGMAPTPAPVAATTAASSSGVKVNVFNQAGPGVDIHTESRKGPDGPEIDVYVAEAILTGGRTREALKDAYGLSPGGRAG